jgi:periplasmic divalent cation tolerance protein
MTRESNSRVVLVTCGKRTEAVKIAHSVVKHKLAACVNMISEPVQSVYRWKGKVETAFEYLLVIKTTKDRLKELEEEVLGLHSYETPEFLVLNVESGSASYLEWIATSTEKRA